MIQKLAVVSALIISASCMFLQQYPIPIQYGLQHSNPSYDFAYAVNDEATGDIKSQHEVRRGDTVVGLYSFIQPDGLRRTAHYRADDHSGFNADVTLVPANHGNAEVKVSDERSCKDCTRMSPVVMTRGSSVLHAPNLRTVWNTVPYV